MSSTLSRVWAPGWVPSSSTAVASARPDASVMKALIAWRTVGTMEAGAAAVVFGRPDCRLGLGVPSTARFGSVEATAFRPGVAGGDAFPSVGGVARATGSCPPP